MLKYQLKRSIVWWVEDVWGRISLWAKPLVIILAVNGMLISIVVAVVAENTKKQSVLLIEKGRVNWVDFTSGYIGVNGLTFGVEGEGSGVIPDTKAMLRNVFPGDSVRFIKRNNFKVRMYEFRITKGL